MRLVIVRHGESEGNAQGRMQGHQDWPLTAHGRSQATLLGRWLKARGLRWSAAYTSPLLRAQQTAELLHAEVGGPEPSIDPDLVEVDAGKLSGLDLDEIKEWFPGFMQRGLEGLGDFQPYGGESYEQLQARVVRLRVRLEEAHRAGDDTVLLVGHGGINFQLVKSLICHPVPHVCILRYGNCTTTLVRMRERRGVFTGEVAWHVPIELIGGEAEDASGALFR